MARVSLLPSKLSARPPNCTVAVRLGVKAGNEIEAANCRLASLRRDQPDDPVEMPTFHEPVANCRASGTPGNGRFQSPPAAPEKPAMPAFSAVASFELRDRKSTRLNSS